MGYTNQRKCKTWQGWYYYSGKDIEGDDNALLKEQRESVFPCRTLLRDINGNSVRPGKVLNIAPSENQIPVSFTQEPDWEALAFVKEFPLETGLFNEERDVPITPVYYTCSFKKCWWLLC